MNIGLLRRANMAPRTAGGAIMASFAVLLVVLAAHASAAEADYASTGSSAYQAQQDYASYPSAMYGAQRDSAASLSQGMAMDQTYSSVNAASGKLENDYAQYASGYQVPAVQAPAYRSPVATNYYAGARRNNMGNSAQCNPCGPPPCPVPCPPPPPPPPSPVPCVMEIPICIQYLINLAVIAFGLGILKWYCSAMSELDRECGGDDARASGGEDSGKLAGRRSSFSPPMATISAYYDPSTNQVLLPQDAQRGHTYQFSR